LKCFLKRKRVFLGCPELGQLRYALQFSRLKKRLDKLLKYKDNKGKIRA
jgi:hypothetical protein